ncbi:MAG: hypothetical protein RI894_2373 [Bacteroidota bacterium]|jgi:hypothetical protein
MKRYTNLLLVTTAITAVSFLSSCDNELKTTGDFKETPVVYGLLNWQDTAQYIRIERAFLDPTTGATVLAADVNNIYFKNASVRLQKVNNVNNQVVQDIALNKVDGAQEGFPRATGIFASTPNYLYKTKERMDTATYNAAGKRTDLYRYRMIILNEDVQKSYTAETRLIPEFYLSTPSPNISQTWVVNPQSPKQRKFEINEVPRNAATFDIDLHFRYQEKDLTTNLVTEKTFVWKLGHKLTPVDGKVTMSVEPVQLYNTLNNYIPVAGSNIVRCGQSLKYYAYVYAAGSDYAKYSQSISENTGVSSSDVIPQYTNVSEGRGFFSSRCLYKSEAFLFTKETVDSIAGSYRTSKLKFTNWTNSICQ